jgi:hypothetical protein
MVGIVTRSRGVTNDQLFFQTKPTTIVTKVAHLNLSKRYRCYDDKL